MAFNKFKGKKGGKGVRLTGLFKSQSHKGLYTGSIKADDLGELISVIKKAKAEEKGIVFFLWKNDEVESSKDPIFTLKANVSEPYERKKQIEVADDDDDDDDTEAEGDSLFD